MAKFKVKIGDKTYTRKDIEKMARMQKYFHIEKEPFDPKIFEDREYNYTVFRKYWSANKWAGYYLRWFPKHFISFIKRRAKILSIPLFKCDMLIHILSAHIQHKRLNNRSNNYTKEYYSINLTKKKIETVQETKENETYTDWICAISGKEIKSKIGDFSIENLIDPSVKERAINNGYVAEEIVKSSLKFREHCIKIYEKSYKNIKDNNKASLKKLKEIFYQNKQNIINGKITKHVSEANKLYYEITGKYYF